MIIISNNWGAWLPFFIWLVDDTRKLLQLYDSEDCTNGFDKRN